MTIRTCKYCGEKFDSEHWRKIFCCYDHKHRYNILKRIKEPVRLSKFEREIWERIKEGEM